VDSFFCSCVDLITFRVFEKRTLEVLGNIKVLLMKFNTAKNEKNKQTKKKNKKNGTA